MKRWTISRATEVLSIYAINHNFPAAQDVTQTDVATAVTQYVASLGCVRLMNFATAVISGRNNYSHGVK